MWEKCKEINIILYQSLGLNESFSWNSSQRSIIIYLCFHNSKGSNIAKFSSCLNGFWNINELSKDKKLILNRIEPESSLNSLIFTVE